MEGALREIVYFYDANGNVSGKGEKIAGQYMVGWNYYWDAQDRLIEVQKDDLDTDQDARVKYRYCQTCGGALSERIEYERGTETIVSWLRYEYDGLNLLRIDERYDGETPAGLDENDPWRPLNVFIHGPGAIGQIVKGKWYNYYSDGQDPTNCCDSGEYYYFYDALGNVNGVLDSGGRYYRWEMDAFGNDLPSGNSFLDMDQPGPKEHLTGKMFDTTTGLYYFAARWYDPQVGRFVSVNLPSSKGHNTQNCGSTSMRDYEGYIFALNSPLRYTDPLGTAVIVNCHPRQISIISVAIRQARDALIKCIRCKVRGRGPGGIQRNVAKDIMSNLTASTIECIPNEFTANGDVICGKAEVGGDKMWLTPAGIFGLPGCPCMEALLIHEGTHLVGEGELTAEACENDCSTCATFDPGQAGGKCQW